MTKKQAAKTKVETVIALCEHKSGCTLEAIADKLAAVRRVAGVPLLEP
ncbi:MAG: hypothetical protein WBM12_11295 [Pseudolabrys sp.]|jgi:hypothetical protein